MRRTLAGILVLAGLVAASVPARAGDVDPEPPSKGGGIMGSWSVVRVVGEGGGPGPNDLVLTFEKNKLSVVIRNQKDKAHTFAIDPKKKPAHINITDTTRNKTIEGIYKIEKGELFLCIGERSGKRPTTFDGKVEPVLVLKKQKK